MQVEPKQWKFQITLGPLRALAAVAAVLAINYCVAHDGVASSAVGVFGGLMMLLAFKGL